MGKLVFGRDMIIPIKHEVDWELMRQKNQSQIDKYNIHENKHRVEYDYKVIDKIMLNNHTAYKYKTPYKGPFLITQCFKNGTVTLQCGATQTKYNIRQIKPYKFDT